MDPDSSPSTIPLMVPLTPSLLSTGVVWGLWALREFTTLAIDQKPKAGKDLLGNVWVAVGRGCRSVLAAFANTAAVGRLRARMLHLVSPKRYFCRLLKDHIQGFCPEPTRQMTLGLLGIAT